jgi:cation transport regulator ChaB
MPYSKSNYPKEIESLPEHAKTIFISAFNSAYEQYDGDESKSMAVAWSSVKTKYKKIDDKWVAKDTNMSEFKGFEDWIEIFKNGKQIDSDGVEHNGDELIDKALKNFNLSQHQPPVVIGHPKNDDPAYAWVSELKDSIIDDGTRVLLAKFKDVVPEFEDVIKKGLYKTRSASFYPDGTLRHVGFLGGMPPAVKGLQNLKFEDVDNYISFEEMENIMENEIKDEVKTQEVIPEIKFSEDELNSKLDEQKIKLETEFDKKLNDTIKKFEEDIKNIKFEQDKKEIKSFLDELSQNGKILPKDVNGLQNFCESLLDSGSFNFEEKSISKLDYFKSFLNGKEPNTTLFKEFDNSNVQLPSNKDDLINQLIKKEQESGLSFSESLKRVNKNNPDLFI